MIYRDPKCVHVADSVGLAEVVVVFLGQEEIPAQVMNPATLGGLDGLTPFSPLGIGASGIEVWVKFPEHAARARQLLAEHAEFQKAAQAETGTIAAVCDECGETSEFPARKRGSVEVCPHCSAYMDVLAPGDETEEMEADEEAF